MCCSPVYIHLLASETMQGLRKLHSLRMKEDRKPVLPGDVSEIRDGMPQHLGVFTRPASVSVEFATENLKMVQERTCSGLLAVIFVVWA